MTNVSTQAELVAAIAARETEIVLTASFDIDELINITYALTIRSDENGPYTLTKSDNYDNSIFLTDTYADLTLQNIVLDGAKQSHPAGGNPQALVTLRYGTLTLGNGSVLQNNRGYSGGGVYIFNGAGIPNALNMRGNAAIRENVATANGGGIYSGGYYAQVSIGDEAVIEGNAAGTGGGGIFYQRTTVQQNYFLDVTGNAKIVGNTAVSGGGIEVRNGKLRIADSVEISGNSASTLGGGIVFYGNNIFLDDGASIRNNTAGTVGGGLYFAPETAAEVALHGLIQENTAASTGGVVILNFIEGNLDLSRARFVKNSSTGEEGEGGGLLFSKTTGQSSAITITLDGAVFDGNQTQRNGGGANIYNTAQSTVELNADGCRFENNIAKNVGGGLLFQTTSNGSLSIQNGIFSKNQALSGGGAYLSNIASDQISVAFRNVEFFENEARTHGAGLNLSGVLAVTLSKVTFNGNATPQNGGGIYFENQASTFSVENDSQFIYNHAGMSGGGIYNESGVVTLTDSSFQYNTAQIGQDIYNSGELLIGSNLRLASGLYISNASSVPEIAQNLSANSLVKLEQSEYVRPSLQGIPVTVATSDLTLTQQDAAAFLAPDEMEGWETRLNDSLSAVVLSPAFYNLSYQNVKDAENPNPLRYTVLTPTIILGNLQNLPDFRFEGWFDAPEGGNRVTEIPLGSTGSKTLFAQWQNLNHTVTYYGNDAGGPPAENLPLPQSVRDGESVTLSDKSPTRTGYLFRNWNTAPDGSGVPYQPEAVVSNVTADIGLYAQWLLLPPDEYVLAYHPNDDPSAPARGMPQNSAVSEGDSVQISLTIPSRAGYAFIGWNTAPDGTGTAYAPGNTITDVRADIDLHAQWTPLPPVPFFKLTYYGNDAGGTPAENVPDPISVEAGQTVTLSPAIPSRAGFRFTSWNTDPSGSGADYLPGERFGPMTNDAGLYAKWRKMSAPTTYAVYFRPNDACGPKAYCLPPTVRYNPELPVRVPRGIPCRPCNCFVGWNTRIDGRGTRYAPGQIIYKRSGDLTLYAQWCRFHG